jgi:hypothetical protein
MLTTRSEIPNRCPWHFDALVDVMHFEHKRHRIYRKSFSVAVNRTVATILDVRSRAAGVISSSGAFFQQG